MKPVQSTQQIACAAEKVFETISDVRNFSKAVDDIKRIEFITEQQVGEGTRFRETREMKGKEQTVELEVTEFVPYERVRMVSDAGGTIWDTVFTVTATEQGSQLDMVMDVRPHKFFAKLMTPLVMGFVRKAVEADMQAVKRYCESTTTE